MFNRIFMAEKGTYCYEYPRPAIASDIIVLTKQKGKLKLLLIERKNEPFAGMYAFPGGFIDPDETASQAAGRELKEETSVASSDLKQFKTYSEPNRDPRGRIMSVVHWVFIPNLSHFKAGDDAASAKLFDINKLPDLAFDHKEILQDFLSAKLI
jgi:8-oxo-dGTP diphosphatase